jgi:hypothetical protein
MTTLIYIIPSDDLSTGIRTALDIYSCSGVQPKIISDGTVSVKFDHHDAYLLAIEEKNESQYTDKHKID